MIDKIEMHKLDFNTRTKLLKVYLRFLFQFKLDHCNRNIIVLDDSMKNKARTVLQRLDLKINPIDA